jgi:hypothetical protein
MLVLSFRLVVFGSALLAIHFYYNGQAGLNI